jgi:circadian clock protein KaiB
MSRPIVSLRLYIAGDAPNSVLAISNISEICRMHYPDSHQLEIVDVFADPMRALEDHVLLTPMLVVCSLTPPRTIVGQLSNPDVVLNVIGSLELHHEQ